MISLVKRFGFLCVVSTLLFQSAQAASLRVSPTMAELNSPESTTTFTLRNEASRPLNAQIRVYRWVQRNGVEELVATTDVVASPPMTALKPNADYTIRVVRVAKTPVKAEESYRVVIDELPDAKAKSAGTVNLVVRHVLPVFFKSADATPASVSWKIIASANGTQLVATNRGDTHLRLSDLTLSQAGKSAFNRKGLVGYVLGGASMQWPITLKNAGGPLKLSATGSNGPISANVATGR